MFTGLVPAGSPRMWIEDVYENPTHPTERTFGPEITLWPIYAGKITLKSFVRVTESVATGYVLSGYQSLI